MLRILLTALCVLLPTPLAFGSSHMDAPLITLDDAANTTDVYAFVSEEGGTKYLTTSLAVYPFEEPGIGPNIFRFDDDVRYEIHVALGPDVDAGRATLSYRFDFHTSFANEDTILQAYLGVVQNVGDESQNLVQTYTVSRVDHRLEGKKKVVLLGGGIVPPNNQGNVTPFYNRKDKGKKPAKPGVATTADLDRYTVQAISFLAHGYMSFAGQRDDGFYADIQGVFDLLNFEKSKSFDSQRGFNVHTIVLNIPVEELGGDLQRAGVYATTSRRRVAILRNPPNDDLKFGDFVQVGRQGNPLFCEGLVAIADKDLYNRTDPTQDAALFAKYANTPELAALINLVLEPDPPALETDRTDLAAIFIPDVIKVDLSTQPARLAGGGPDDPDNPDDAGFSRLGIFGDDVLVSQIQDGFGGGVLPGGWPNGRRFGDDVVDVAISAILSDLRDLANLVIVVADGVDGVSENDIAYNKVFPYAATPLNGRNHKHH